MTRLRSPKRPVSGRWIRKTLVSLGIGVLLTVAAAQAFAWRGLPYGAPMQHACSVIHAPTVSWTVRQEERFGRTSIVRTASPSPVYESCSEQRPAGWSRVWIAPTLDETTSGNTQHWETAFGLPFRSMRCEFEYNLVSGTYVLVSGLRRPELARAKWSFPVPTALLIPGFVTDTLLFGIAVFLLLCIRPVIRRFRGSCTRCGYDLRGSGSNRCPECGGPSTSSRAAHKSS